MVRIEGHPRLCQFPGLAIQKLRLTTPITAAWYFIALYPIQNIRMSVRWVYGAIAVFG